MKIFANKSMWKKLVIIFLLINLFSFAAPKPVAAGIGGTLMEPICDFLVWAGDGLVNVVHRILIHQNDTLLKVDLNEGIIGFFRVLFTVIAAIGVLALICVGGWFAFDALLGLFNATWTMAAAAAFGSVIVLGVVSSMYVGAQVYSIDGWDNEVHIPLYSITPEEIFKGDVKLFNVDFFDSNDGGSDPYTYDFVDMELGNINFGSPIEGFVDLEPLTYNTMADEHNYPRKNLFFQDSQTTDSNSLTTTITYYYIESAQNGSQTIYKLVEKIIPPGPDTGLATTSDTYTLYSITDDGSGAIHSGRTYNYGYQLKDTVAVWYRRILILSIVGMMSVLVYIGIRMTLSSVSSQKAKYKQMLGDWFIGMVLLFSMHYIMVFSNLFVNKLTEVLKGVTPKVYLTFLEDKNDKIENALRSSRFQISTELNQMGGTGTGAAKYVYKKVDPETNKSYLMMQTNMMGKLRYDVRYNKEKSEGYIGYTILYIMMICYLGIYVFIYFKRVIYMAFLTIIAPLVALTYPIDKVTDGKAQGFDVWFKEYIFNLLLQPLHLLLYTILIGSAMELATENVIYSIVVLGFMTPAEKLLRQMFNFQKASTPGLFAGAAGAGLLMTGMKWIMGRGSSKGGSGGSSKGGSKEEEEDFLRKGSGGKKVDYAKTLSGNINEKEEGKPLLPLGQEKEPLTPFEQQMTGWDTDNLKTQIKLQRDKVDDTYGLKEAAKLEQMENELSRRESLAATNTTEPESKLEDLSKVQKMKMGTKKALKNSFDTYKAYRKEKFKRDLTQGKPIRKLSRMVTGALGAATFGTAAVGIGMSSGDFTKVGQYGTLGVAGGYSLGVGSSDRLNDSIQADGALAAAIKEYKLNTTDMEELKKQKDEQILKRAKANAKLKQEYMEKFNESTEQYEKWVDNFYMLYNDNKISEDDIIKTEDFARHDIGLNGDELSRKKTIIAATERKRTGLKNLNTDEQMKRAKDEVTKKLKGYGIPDENIEDTWNRMIRYNDKMNM